MWRSVAVSHGETPEEAVAAALAAPAAILVPLAKKLLPRTLCADSARLPPTITAAMRAEEDVVPLGCAFAYVVRPEKGNVLEILAIGTRCHLGSTEMCTHIRHLRTPPLHDAFDSSVTQHTAQSWRVRQWGGAESASFESSCDAAPSSRSSYPPSTPIPASEGAPPSTAQPFLIENGSSPSPYANIVRTDKLPLDLWTLRNDLRTLITLYTHALDFLQGEWGWVPHGDAAAVAALTQLCCNAYSEDTPAFSRVRAESIGDWLTRRLGEDIASRDQQGLLLCVVAGALAAHGDSELCEWWSAVLSFGQTVCALAAKCSAEDAQRVARAAAETMRFSRSAERVDTTVDAVCDSTTKHIVRTLTRRASMLRCNIPVERDLDECDE